MALTLILLSFNIATNISAIMLSDTNENKEPLMEIFLFLEVMFFIIIYFHTKEPTLHTFYLQVTSHKGAGFHEHWLWNEIPLCRVIGIANNNFENPLSFDATHE